MDSKIPLISEKSEFAEDTRSSAGLRSSHSKHRTRPAILLWVISSLLICFALASIRSSLPLKTSATEEILHSLTKYAVPPAFLQVFQVYPPVLTPTSNGTEFTDGSGAAPSIRVQSKKRGCVVQQMLMKHSFANSYNMPFVGTYTPPSCHFNRVTFNLTAVSAGRQFDRLGAVYFGNTEIWRTSTAEPTKTGIEWVYIKDMSAYLALFNEPQKLIFDLGNLINDIYTAPFNVTLTATFFTSEDTVDPADRIVAVSPRLAANNTPSVWQYPEMQAINTLKLPRNIRKAVFTMSATGQIDEEFWFGNVPTSDANTFGKGVLFPYSPFREIQLYIDGKLAGVAWPFPIIFTGGVVPGFWRPIVGIDTFDLKEEEIDITPWLPLLCDGKHHSFELKVVGINDNGRGHGELTPNIGSYWLLTGKIFLWLDPSGSVTTGSSIQRNAARPSIQLSSKTTKNPKGKNQTLGYTVDVQRDLSITSTIKTASGSSKAFWVQRLAYSNAGDITNFANTQALTQSTNGSDISSSGYARRIAYPITVNSTFAENPKTKAFTIDGTLYRVQDIAIAGSPVFPTGLQSFDSVRSSKKTPRLQGSILHTSQNGSAHYFANGANTIVNSSGTTQQDMTFTGFRVDGDRMSGGHWFPSQQGSTELYRRHVLATNGTVVENEESLEGRPFGGFSKPLLSVGDSSGSFAGGSIKRLLGHGPGHP